MLYPVYVHLGDANHSHGAELPDFPGCFSAADELEDLPARIQEAVEIYCKNEHMTIPRPSPLHELRADNSYEGGIWLMADGRWPMADGRY